MAYEILWSGVVATVGLVLASIGIGDFMQINTSMIAQAYIVVGRLLKQWIENADQWETGNFAHLTDGAVLASRECDGIMEEDGTDWDKNYLDEHYNIVG